MRQLQCWKISQVAVYDREYYQDIHIKRLNALEYQGLPPALLMWFKMKSRSALTFHQDQDVYYLVSLRYLLCAL